MKDISTGNSDFIIKIKNWVDESNVLFAVNNYVSENDVIELSEDEMLALHADDPIWMDYYNGLKAGYNVDVFNTYIKDGKYYFKRNARICFRLSNTVIAECNHWMDFTDNDKRAIIMHLEALIKESAYTCNIFATNRLAHKIEKLMEE